MAWIRFEARKAMVADLDKEGLLLKVEPIVHSVGHSERTGVQVEARLSTQWFVKMKPLADAAIKAQQEADKKVTFVPDRFEHTYLSMDGKYSRLGYFFGNFGGVIKFRLGTTSRLARPMWAWKHQRH